MPTALPQSARLHLASGYAGRSTDSVSVPHFDFMQINPLRTELPYRGSRRAITFPPNTQNRSVTGDARHDGDAHFLPTHAASRTSPTLRFQ